MGGWIAKCKVMQRSGGIGDRGGWMDYTRKCV